MTLMFKKCELLHLTVIKKSSKIKYNTFQYFSLCIIIVWLKKKCTASKNVY